MVVTLQDDLFHLLKDVPKEKAATSFGIWVQCLTQKLQDMIKTRRTQLPVKAKADNGDEPIFYWVAFPFNETLSRSTISMVNKWNNTVESVLKQYDNMRMIHFKEIWDSKSLNLFHNDSLTFEGKDVFFSTLDMSVKFNLQKRKESLLRRDAKKLSQSTQSHPHVTKRKGGPQDIPNFFKRHKNDCFHWERSNETEDRPHSKFLLPKFK